jgi:hypothetical protein
MHFEFSLERIFFFLFFSAAYSFLNFWIGSTLFLFPPFALLGLGGFLFVLFFHRLVMVGIGRATPSHRGSRQSKSPVLLLVPLIATTVLYIFGVRYLQELVISQLFVPAASFTAVSWSLTIVSLLFSWTLSFLVRP